VKVGAWAPPARTEAAAAADAAAAAAATDPDISAANGLSTARDSSLAPPPALPLALSLGPAGRPSRATVRAARAAGAKIRGVGERALDEADPTVASPALVAAAGDHTTGAPTPGPQTLPSPLAPTAVESQPAPGRDCTDTRFGDTAGTGEGKDFGVKEPKRPGAAPRPQAAVAETGVAPGEHTWLSNGPVPRGGTSASSTLRELLSASCG
jgi:hypothetical protein